MATAAISAAPAGEYFLMEDLLLFGGYVSTAVKPALSHDR